VKDIINNSIRYWEPHRVAFKAVLALVVTGSFFHHQSSLASLTWQRVIGLLLAAVLANGLYCGLRGRPPGPVVQLPGDLATPPVVALGGGNGVCRRDFSVA
jgi:protein-S-isoprenylcysteine O-methyltransferase Ste14